MANPLPLQQRLGFSTASLANHSLPEACRLGQGLGFEAIELLAFDGYRHSQGNLAGFYFERLSEEERRELRRLVEGFAHVSTHAPFFEMPILSPNPALRGAAQRQLEIAIEAVAHLGGSTTTTHAYSIATHTLEESLPELVELYRRLGDRAAKHGVTVTIETGWPADVAAFADLIHAIDHEHVGANVDVGHLENQVPRGLIGTQEGVALYNDLLERHLRSLGRKLMHFHLHDVREDDFRDHRACGRGIIDYRRLLRVARELGYEGLLVFELEEPDLEAALAESREVLLRAAGGKSG